MQPARETRYDVVSVRAAIAATMPLTQPDAAPVPGAASGYSAARVARSSTRTIGTDGTIAPVLTLGRATLGPIAGGAALAAVALAMAQGRTTTGRRDAGSDASVPGADAAFSSPFGGLTEGSTQTGT